MTANGYRGEVDVQIGGETRVLRFSWDAMARAKAAVGDQLFSAVVDMDFDVLAQLLVIGLADGWPEATPEEIKSISPPILLIQQALIEALNLAFYGRKEGAAAEPEPDPIGATDGVPATGSPSPEMPHSTAGSVPVNSGS